MELTLEAWVWVELTPSVREWERWPCLLQTAAPGDLAGAVAGELILMVQIKESLQADQLSRHPDPNRGL